MKPVLILTAKESTWPSNKSTPVLFLGEWCKPYSRKSIWSELDYSVEPYHWNNRKKLKSDSQYLENLYEKILKEITCELNQVHSVNFSERYWRIIIGPWLKIFIQILYDRWFMMKQTIEKNNFSSCIVSEVDALLFVPNDMVEFNNLSHTDDYNEAIFSQLLEYCWPNVKVIRKEISSKKSNKNFVNNKSGAISKPSLLKKILIRFIKSTLTILSKWISKPNNYFFINTYLGILQEFKLQSSLGQIPNYWGEWPSIEIASPNTKARKLFFESNVDYEDSFEKALRKMIKNNIPTSYLEGYDTLHSQSKKIQWPDRPKAIFTSNLFYDDDIFKVYLAQKTELNIPLIIGQHGGHYGIGKIDSHLHHELAICDKFISWGWKIDSQSKIIPIVKLKAAESKVSYNPNGSALLLYLSIPRYSRQLSSIPISGQYLKYINDQNVFIKSLSRKIRQELVVRLQPNPYNWGETERLNDEFSNLTIDKGNQNIIKQVRNCRVYISTYNATTFLEALNWNVPTLIFWDPYYSELKEEAIPFFELLKSVGIFHEYPESAAKHLTDNWEQIDVWWHSKEVQDARLKFCNKYARSDKNFSSKIKDLLLDLNV